jgi:hypothetical protein
MLTGPTVWVASPSSHRSRPNRGREPPCPPPSPIATTIAPISGTPRCARERRTRLCLWPRQSCHRRRLHRRPFPPASVSLTSGTRSSATRAGGRPSVGRAREWAAPLGFGPHCRVSGHVSSGPRWRASRPSVLFCFKKRIQFLYYFT